MNCKTSLEIHQLEAKQATRQRVTLTNSSNVSFALGSLLSLLCALLVVSLRVATASKSGLQKRGNSALIVEAI